MLDLTFGLTDAYILDLAYGLIDTYILDRVVTVREKNLETEKFSCRGEKLRNYIFSQGNSKKKGAS